LATYRFSTNGTHKWSDCRVWWRHIFELVWNDVWKQAGRILWKYL